MVQRYELSDRWGQPEMAKYAYGDYVEYDDYLQLEAKLREFADQVLYAPVDSRTVRP